MSTAYIERVVTVLGRVGVSIIGKTIGVGVVGGLIFFSLSPAETAFAAPGPDSFDKGLISLTFDDGYKSVFDHIGLLNNFKSTQYIYTIPMYGAELCQGGCYEEFMSTSNVLALKASGHEIASHTRSHQDLSTLSALPKMFEINGSRLDLLKSVGLSMSNLAYPFGGFDNTTVSALRAAGFTGARTVDFINALGQATLNTKATDRYRLHAVQINDTTPITLDDVTNNPPQGWQSNWGYVEKWIDEAVANHEWLIFVFHHVKEDCAGNSICISTQKLSSIISYLESKGNALDVVTIDKGLAMMHDVPQSDGVAPVIVQENIVAPATSDTGASVTFSPTVTDNDSKLPATLQAFCTILPEREFVFPEGNAASGILFPTPISSGYIFPIGTTDVTCKAADVGGNTATRVFTVTVTPKATTTPPNTLPVAYSQTVNVRKNSKVSITLTGSDADPGDKLTFIITSQPIHGSLRGRAPRFTYTPRIGFVGTDTFSFKVSDGKGESADVQVTLLVKETSRPTFPIPWPTTPRFPTGISTP